MRPFAVLFSVTLFVVVLPFAARAQEGTAEETTVQAKDAASASVEATSSVSAETGQGPSSSKTGSRESSGLTLQTQTDEGSQSQAASGDLNTAQNSGIPAGTPAPGTNPDNPSSPPNTITIGVESCTVSEGASITVEDGDGTEARFVDGSKAIEITGTQNEITIEGPPGDFIGNHAVSTSDPGFDTDGDYTVVTSSGIRCADSGDGGGGGSGGNSSCQNRHEVASLDELDEGDTINFRTQGNKFRVSYDVFFDSNASNRRFRIEIGRNGNVVDSEETSVDQTDATFFVSDGSDNYSIKATLSDAGADPTFDVLVDDCRGSNNNNNDGRNRHHHRHHDRNRFHHRHHDRNRFHHNNRFFGRGGAADFQYDRTVEERVIKETIPKNKGRLAATGGVPFTGAALLGLASVGLGVSILRSAIRRES
jgi:hypothetical protein